MNRIHTTLVITGLCALIVGWQLWQSNETATSGTTGELMPVAQDPLDPPPNSGSPEDSVIGLSVAGQDPFDFQRRIEENPDCHPDILVRNPATGDIEQTWACDSSAEAAHPYESWSEAVLAGMAYGDAKAAEVLGLRHIQSEDPNREALGLMLLYRSVALSGDTSALHRAIATRYAIVAEDGKPVLHNLEQLLVFGIVTSRLGDTTISTPAIEARLAGANVSHEEIERIKDDASAILDHMATIEREVTGNSRIEEALSNA